MAIRRAHPSDMVLSWTSDFAKAYRQVAQTPHQLQYAIVAQWCPQVSKLVFIVSAGQLFGGMTPPLNFSRHPAWWCYTMAALYGLPLQQTADDVIATEREGVVNSGNYVWRQTIEAGGWDIPDSKSPLPAPDACMLGADVRHTVTSSVLDITETRVQTISDTILLHLDKCILTAGVAGKLYGRLSATSSQTHGKYGRAKLSPLQKRQYQHHCSTLTHQLRSALV